MTNDARRAWIAQALARTCTCYVFAHDDDLLAFLEHHVAHCAFIDFVAGDATSLGETVRRIRQTAPYMPIGVLCRLDCDTCRSLPALGRAGVSDVIFDDLEPLATRLIGIAERSRAAVVTANALTAVEHYAPRQVHAFFRYCVENAHHPLNVQSIASALGVHRNTLQQRFAGAGLPTPSETMAHVRLLLAAASILDSGEGIERVALALGFGSRSALDRAFRRRLGVRVADLPALGLAPLLDRFVRFLCGGAERRPERAVADGGDPAA